MTPGQARPGPAEEQAALRSGAAADAAEDMFDVVNLPRQDTGIAGVVFVSTEQGAHGPRVKWYPGRPGHVVPCLTVTLEAPPRIINHGLPEQDARAAGREVAEWVSLNRQALLRFWRDGLSWTRDEVDAFVATLVKLP